MDRPDLRPVAEVREPDHGPAGGQDEGVSEEGGVPSAEELVGLPDATPLVLEPVLAAEGIAGDHVHFVGDVMYDAYLANREIARRGSDALKRLGLTPRAYALVTIHRAGNTDDPDRLRRLVAGLNQVREMVIFPVHPRTQKALAQAQIVFEPHVTRIDPRQLPAPAPGQLRLLG